jgi:23S rRNA (guanosine2251-2'-O)-methyltransferase
VHQAKAHQAKPYQDRPRQEWRKDGPAPKPWAKPRPGMERKGPERRVSEPKPEVPPAARSRARVVALDRQAPVVPDLARDHGGPKGSYWIYGHHAVLAAIDNPKRRIRRLVQAGAGGERQGARAAIGGSERPLPAWETVERPVLDRLAGRESVHQGVAAQVELLAEIEIEELTAAAADRPDAPLIILDQVTDPHNVGAILRSAAAFGALGVVLTERHAAPETGVLAKAASGALELVPLVRVANLARAMEQLKAAGFWCVGLAAEAERTLAQARLSGRVALCLGAEGSGLRRLTRAHCDLLVKLPTSGPIDHLNVSNAAAVALYELARTA